MNRTCCPHCGGGSGYFTTQRRKVSRSYDWEGRSEDMNDEQVLSETLPHCLDCGKLVRPTAPSSTQQGEGK